MKKTLIAALASLMLAGALSAVDGATPMNSGGRVILLVDGGTVLPVAFGNPDVDGEAVTSQN